MRPVFLDTNVFLYAAGADHPERAACQRVLERTADGDFPATTSAEVVQEILHVLSRRGRVRDGLRLARNVLSLFPDLLAVEAADLAVAIDMMERHKGLPARDALHAAVASRRGLTDIVSVDSHFDVLEGIRRVAPGELAGS